MKEKLKSMDHNGVWDLIKLPEDCKRVIVNGFLRPNTTQMAISNDIRLDLLPRVLLRRTALTAMRHFLLFQKMTLLELSWRW